MALGLLLLPAIGGYWFLTHFNYTRFQAVRDSGYHVLFRSALWGGLLFCLARVLTLVLDSQYPGTSALWGHHFPNPYSLEVVLSIFLGFLLPLIMNWFYSAERGSKKAARDNGDHIELLLSESIERGLWVEISLRNRKSYVGFALESGVGISGETDIALIPMASGYRDKATLDLQISMDYVPIILKYAYDPEEGLQEEDFRIVIPISEVVSVRLFNDVVYEYFQGT